MATQELGDFLYNAELQHYHSALTNELKITTVSQLKYVEESDLSEIGMTKPEMRRLKKYYRKEHPHGTFGKLKKAILRQGSDGGGRTLSPSPPINRISRPVSYARPAGKQIIPSESLSVLKDLGEGEFGVVKQGVWTTETGDKVQVAIKCLSKDRMVQGVSEFLKEAQIMQTIDHENIVHMFGVVLGKENSLMLVTELASMRSLLECLKEPSLRLDFNLPRLCDIAQQICDGMSYLESKRLIHRDLAARNLLVFSKHKVKISDFGLSRALGVGKDYYQSKFSINLKLPIAWCSPECINYLKFTSASDVWAYAVTLWEMFTYGFQPWAGLTGEQILDAIDRPNCQRLEWPDLCPKDYYELMQRCWSQDPKERPTFSEIFIKLPQMRPVQLKAVKPYPNTIVERGYLYYKAYDVVIVLDKNPANAPVRGLWKGVLTTGKGGYFDPMNMVPFIEPKTSPISLVKPNILRKESSRKSNRKLRLDMISRPQNDLRHTGHIGYDGAVFGDVSFIGDKYDQIPVKAGDENSQGSCQSLSRFTDIPDRNYSRNTRQSELGYRHGTNGISNSWISQDSINSEYFDKSGSKTPPYQDIDDNALDDFELPDLDLGSSFNFEYGSSILDDVLKAFQEKSKKESSPESVDNTPEADCREFSTIDEVRVSNGLSKGTWNGSMSPSSSGDPSPRVAPPLPLSLPRSLRKSSEAQKGDRSGSSSPQVMQSETPPPLPVSIPKTDARREAKHDSKKQATVKPMSVADKKLIEDAFAMAEEVDQQKNRSQMSNTPSPQSPRRSRHLSDSGSGTESPGFMSRIKWSVKKSPKVEKRNFSEEMSAKAEEDLPPESQEAYNILVARGSTKDRDLNQSANSSRDFSQSPNSSRDTSQSPISSKDLNQSTSSWRSESDRFSPARSAHMGLERKLSPRGLHLDIDRKSPSRGSSSSGDQSVLSRVYQFEIDKNSPARDCHLDSDRKSSPARCSHHSSNAGSPPRGLVVNLDGKVPSKPLTVDISRDSPARVLTIDRVSPVSSMDDDRVSQDDTSSIAKSDSSWQDDFRDVTRSDETYDLHMSFSHDEHESIPVIKPRSDTKRSVIPVPKPRPEIRVEPVQRSGQADVQLISLPKSEELSKSAGDDSDDKDNFKKPLPVDKDKFSSQTSEADVTAFPERRDSKSLFDEEFTEPSPREIMSRLARESRIRRSLDHHRMSDGQDYSAQRNLREPQGIPGKTTSSSEVEVDTNPLRMLRGGAIPIRSSRGAAGTTAKPSSLRYPKLQFGRLLSDPGPQEDEESEPGRVPPPVPQRSISHVETVTNPLPLPPRKAIRPGVLNAKPHARKYPLVITNSGLVPSPESSPVPPLDSAPHVFAPYLHDPSPDLPPAPPPPIFLAADHNEDNVFDVEDSAQLTAMLANRDGGQSGSSTFPRRKFGLNNVQCNLEQLGFYNHEDPFWFKPVVLPERTHSDNDFTEEIRPIPASYKTSDNVSYEDLLDFALDRQANCEEIKLMKLVLSNDVTVEDCSEALRDTNQDIHKAIKYVKLKQLLSVQLGDVNFCKEALMSCNWDVPRAAEYMLAHPLPSPECVDV